MKKDYLLPGAIALALIAIPMFGFRRSPTAAVVKVVAAKPLNVAILTPPPIAGAQSAAGDGSSSSERTNAPSLPPRPTDLPHPFIRTVPDLGPIHVDHPPLPNQTVHWTFPGKPGDGGSPGIIPSSLLDSTPKALAQIPPLYPPSARHNGLAGQVVVRFWVDENGRVHDARVVSSTSVEFQEATLEAVAKWRFEPGRKDGRLTPYEMAVPVDFQVTE